MDVEEQFLSDQRIIAEKRQIRQDTRDQLDLKEDEPKFLPTDEGFNHDGFPTDSPLRNVKLYQHENPDSPDPRQIPPTSPLDYPSMLPPDGITHLSGRWIRARDGRTKWVSYAQPLTLQLPVNTPMLREHWDDRTLPWGETYLHGITTLPVPGVVHKDAPTNNRMYSGKQHHEPHTIRQTYNPDTKTWVGYYEQGAPPVIEKPPQYQSIPSSYASRSHTRRERIARPNEDASC